MQEGNNTTNEEQPFAYFETGFGSIELRCRACGQLLASDLRTMNAVFYRGLLHLKECPVKRGYHSGQEPSGQNAT